MSNIIACSTRGLVVGDFANSRDADPKINIKTACVASFVQVTTAAFALWACNRFCPLSQRTVSWVLWSSAIFSGLVYATSPWVFCRPEGYCTMVVLRPLVYGSLYVALTTRSWHNPASIALLGAACGPPVINACAAAINGE